MIFDLFWSFLCIGLLILLIVFYWKITKLIKEKYGIGLAILFVILTLGAGGSGDRSAKSKSKFETGTWVGPAIKSLPQGRLDTTIVLYNHLISKFELRVVGINDTLKNTMSLEAHTSSSGWEAGCQWMSPTIIINQLGDLNEWQYEVSGSLSWSILGIHVYTTDEIDYKGIISHLKHRKL